MRRILVVYVLALALSHAWRAWSPRDEPEPAEGEQHVEVRAADREGLVDGAVRLAVELRGEPPEAGEPWVVTLHGSPGGAGDLAGVAAELARTRAVASPDLPGFGDSTRDVPDYSHRAHARYVLQLADRLGARELDLVAFSMGGGVALHVFDLAPERVRSITLISSIGVQELELLGDHHLNRAIHALQLGVLWAARELVPHFGALDRAFVSVEYGRNFFDSDQRPLRGILERWDGPMLVLHGVADPLVPVAAAREHARIVPQAALQELEGGHFLAFRRGAELGGRVERFLDAVDAADAGRAPRRSEASPARLAASREPFDPSAVPAVGGISLAIVVLLLAASTLVSEDLACIGAGALVAHGRLSLAWASAGCFLGILVGDVALYAAGRWLGPRALSVAPLRWVVTPDRVAAAGVWFGRRGIAAVFLSRFVPGSRLPTYVVAGVVRASFWRFLLWFVLAAGLWTPSLVWLSSWVGGELSEKVELFREYAVVALVATLAVVLVALKGVPLAFSHRRRRRLVGRLRRIARWEYWPAWIVYAPVALGLVPTARRHRSTTLFTAANPAIPLSGVIGESKTAILERLVTTPEHVPAWAPIPAGPTAARVERARDFLQSRGLGWPVVLKPDAGQRGLDVEIVRSDAELEEWLASKPHDAILQEHVPGVELGVFWARHPDEPRGRLLSIAEKRPPVVVGDGRHDIERLILDDERAVCMARYLLGRNAARLRDVPPAGERVVLSELGTHCRGARFVDAREHATPELAAAIERVARGFEGFHFGRFDVRAPSIEDLRAGRFRIIELNGVTSEVAHVYDPRFGFRDAVRELVGQWELAFEIGAANARRGAYVAGWRDVARALLAWRRERRARDRSGAIVPRAPSGTRRAAAAGPSR